MTRMWHWEVRVLGETQHVSHVKQYLLSGGMSLRRDAESDAWWLSWDRVDAFEDAREALELVRRELATLSGVLKLTVGSANALKPGGMLKVHEDGRRDFHLIVTRGIRLQGQMSEDHGLAMYKLSIVDPAVSKALRLFAYEDFESWVGLYRLYELVKSDSGGAADLVARGWTTNPEQKRFRHSANSVAVGGDDSRHGAEITNPPTAPMSLSDAQCYVEQIFQMWLLEKVANGV